MTTHKGENNDKNFWIIYLVIFLEILFFVLICSLLDYTGPFLINLIINYITDPNRTLTTGIYIVLGIVAARVLLSIFSARRRLLLVRCGINIVY